MIPVEPRDPSPHKPRNIKGLAVHACRRHGYDIIKDKDLCHLLAR
jgi:hypothetical protein